MNALLFLAVFASGICSIQSRDDQDIPPLTCFRRRYECENLGRHTFITPVGTACPKRCALERKPYTYFSYNVRTDQCWCLTTCKPKLTWWDLKYSGLVSMERTPGFFCEEDKKNEVERWKSAASIPSPGPGCKYRLGVSCNSRDFRYSGSIGKHLTLEYCRGGCYSHPQAKYSQYDERTGYCYCFPSCPNAQRGGIFENVGVLYDDVDNVCTKPA